MSAVCDLHTHSYYSDGTLSPAQLLAEAEKAGLSAIALCDHNCIAGLTEFMAAAKEGAVEAIPGIEFSAEYEGLELHILGLFIRPAFYGKITAMMEDLLARKERSEKALVEALRREGLELCYEDIKAETKNGYVNRAHIAAQILRMGYAASFREAFDQYLSAEKGFYVPPKRLDAFEVIRFIKSIGAVAVLAHPFLSLTENRLREFLPQAVQEGLDAMETLYSEYDEQTTRKAEELATEYGLLRSGGSDYHGSNKPAIHLGTGQGNLRIPMALLEQLRKRVTE